MAHPYYPSGDDVGPEHQFKHDAHPVSHLMHADGQQDAGERGSSCMSPALEIDGKTRNSTRRRIQVACNRCRKRKIKCSGDIGDGQGCSNCQASGNGNCQFLRVNSSMLQTKVSGWPYPVPNAAAPPPSQRHGIYTHPFTQKGGILPTNSSSMRLGSFPRASGYEIGIFAPLHGSNRPAFSVDHPINYEEVPTAYSPQPSSYMFSNTQQGVPSEYCEITWNPKAWGSNLQVNRTSNGTLFTNQDTENSFTASSYPYLFSGQGAQSTDVPPVVPTIPCTPPDGQGADRTLPNPAGRDQLQIGLSCLTATSDTILGLPMPSEYRFGDFSAPRGSISSSSRPSVQISSNGSLCGGSPVQTTRTGQPNAQDMVFDYLPLTSTGPSSHLVSSGGALPTYEPLESSHDFRGSESRVARSLSRDAGRFASLMGCSSDVYGYSSSEKIKNRSEASDTGPRATLMNGLPYTRPRHADAHTTIPFDLLSTDVLSDYRGPAEIHHAPSVSVLSNPGGY